MDCSLPTDVIVDVLSTLPVKSLLRFRCVSKKWLHLISSTSPVSVKNLHDERSQRNHFLILWNSIYVENNYHFGIKENNDRDRFRLSEVDMVDETVHSKFEVRISDLERVVCCRNLVCLVSRPAVHVCNPSTHELVKLLDSPNSNCRFDIAFGYLPSTNQYKLLTWFHPVNNGDLDRRNNMGWNVFSVSDSGRVDSGSWKLIANQPYRNFLYLDSRAVCVNGVIYWRFTRTNPDSVYGTMLSFDLEKEEHELVFHPKLFLSNVDDNAYLLELKGYLSLVDRHPEQISIWIMKDQKNPEDWVLEYTVNLPLHFLYDYILVVASIDAADNGEEELVFLSKNEGVLYYNVDDGSIRSTDNLMHLTMRGIEEPFHYFDSFFSLGSA